MGFPENLKKRREELHLTRLQLALELNVTPSAIGNYENGVSHPKINLLYRLFEVLDCDANYLFRSGENDNPSQTLSPQESELIQYFGRLDPNRQDKAIQMMHDLYRDKLSDELAHTYRAIALGGDAKEYHIESPEKQKKIDEIIEKLIEMEQRK